MLALSAIWVGAQQAPANATPAQPATTQPAAAKAAASNQATTAKKRRGAKKQAEPASEKPVVQATPPPPQTPEEAPAATPRVNYQNGQLTIDSENSTLTSILSALKAQLGVSVEAPAGSGSERIATRVGPGDPRDVLNSLLNNTKYDFMLIGDPGAPLSVQKIILTGRANPAQTQVASGTTAPAAAQGAQIQPDPNQALPDAEVDDTNEIDQPPPPTEPPTPAEQPSAQGNDQNSNAGKTPEQLLQELQRMQQQQNQQNQQNQNQNQNPR